MRSADNINESIKKLHVPVSARLDEKIYGEISRAAGTKEKRLAKPPIVWRIIMKSKLTKLAVAAVIIIVAVLSLTIFDKSVPSAYALEQTIEASRDLRLLYFEYFSDPEGKPIKECWIEFRSNGGPKNVRTNLHAHWNIVHVWKEGETKTWLKDENTLQLFGEGPATEMMLRFVRERDPKTALQALYDRQANGDVTIEIKETPNKDEPIVVKATFLPGRYIPDRPTLPAFRDVLYIDQDTKLVTAIEVYELKDGVYEYNGVWESFKYDEPFEPNIFELEGEVPDDVKRLTITN